MSSTPDVTLMPPAKVYLVFYYLHYQHTEVRGVYEDKAQAVNAVHAIIAKSFNPRAYKESNDNPCYWNGPNDDYEVKEFDVL